MLSLSETAKDGAVIAIVGEYETIPGLTMFSLSALEVLCDYALYKSTFTLHLEQSANRSHVVRFGT